MIKCISHKKVFPTFEIAEDALIEARTNYNYGSQGGPVAVYQCEDCGQYHLTSKGVTNPKLERQMKEGKIDLQKEGNKWLDKIKRK